VLGPDGQVEAVGGLTRDVTDIERTTNALKEADRRKDEFLATLAHELRNPLAPLVTGLSLMKGAVTDQAHAEVLNSMERQLHHMVHMVDDLLDLSRVSRGAFELRRGRHDLRQVLLQTVESSRSLLEKDSHRLLWHVPDRELPVMGDATRLSQIFSNLLHNASKFTRRGGTITVEASVDDRKIRVAVTDTGIGIGEEDLTRVFEMFSQVVPYGEMQGGLGIGLHVAKRLVEMHGGTIAASSAGSGHGSTFTVTLPLSTETPAEAPIVVSGKVFRARRVMIVDDNVDAAFTLSLLLKHKGHDVHATNGAKEALDLARTFRPEVIFLDIGMPELDGYEACRRIRQMDAVKHAYVVALTGWGQDRDRRRAIEAGFDAHLVKPVDPDRIDALLADMPERIGMPMA
jgi:CheY-like chemotaxis protein